mgnify:CR=1 FL=1
MKSNKYTIVCEGQTEKYLFQELKTTIFENKKIQQCKKHKPKVIKGTINTNSYIDGNDCCIVFYLIDEDELKSNEIFRDDRRADTCDVLGSPTWLVPIA